ncbi:MAG: crotonase/enoyl-CoA hydratase family protein [Pseudomonadota bacterium]
MNILDRVLIERHGEHVAIVSLNRPEKYNAIDSDMMHALVKAQRIIKKDRSIRVVILTAKGPSFCAGLDVSNFSAPPLKLLKDALKFGRSDNIFQRCAAVWRDLPVPVIAVINGNCFGGGLQIALGADIRYSAQDASYSIMESKWGLIPDMSGLLSAPEVMRLDHFMQLTLSADIVDASTAMDYGLVTHVEAEPLRAALAFSEVLLTRSPDAHAVTKKLVRKVWVNGSKRSTLFWETWYQLRLLLSRKNISVSTYNNASKNDSKPRRPFSNRRL